MTELKDSNTKYLDKFDSALNHDFCPWANKWVYWIKHPLVGILVPSLVAGLCGIYVAPQAWLFFAGLLFVGVLGLVLPAITIKAIRGSVHFEQAWCEEGNETHIKVKITNHLPIPIWGLSLSGGVPGEELLVSFSRVSAWETKEYLWSFTPRQRGVYPSSPIYIETGFPFGVWTAKRKAEINGEFVILPKPVELDSIPDIHQQVSFDDFFSDRKTGNSGDVSGTRQFRKGDSLRNVHWALTARTSKMICCERQAPLQASAFVSLDLNQEHHSTPGPNSSLEWSIRIFAGICQELVNRGIRVQADLGTDIVPVQAGKNGMNRLLLRLARLPMEGFKESELKNNTRAQKGLLITVKTNESPQTNHGLKIVLNANRFEENSLKENRENEKTNDSFTPTILKQNQIVVEGAEGLRAALKHDWRKLCYASS